MTIAQQTTLSDIIFIFDIAAVICCLVVAVSPRCCSGSYFTGCLNLWSTFLLFVPLDQLLLTTRHSFLQGINNASLFLDDLLLRHDLINESITN